MDSYDIIHAAQNRAMNTYTLEDAREALRASIDRAYKLAEIPLPTALEYEQLVGNITDKVLRSYPYLTSQEVALVADAGVAGELGGRTRPSAAAFFGWLAAYVGSDTRKEAIRNYRRGNTHDPSASEPTRAEKDELNRQAEVRALRTLWAEFKKNGRILETEHFRGYVAMAMDGFEKRGIMRLTPENWEAARKVVRENRRRWDLGTLGFRAAAPDVPGSVVKWAMLEMCFRGLVNANYELELQS